MTSPTAKQLANLKKWKPGQSGNPAGARKHNQEKKAVKRLTEAEFVDLASLVVQGDVSALQTIVKNKEGSVLKVYIAACLVKGMIRGDYGTLDKIMDRLIGKVKERVEHSGQLGVEHLISNEEAEKIVNDPDAVRAIEAASAACLKAVKERTNGKDPQSDPTS